jgi:hypothetical protein
MMMAISAMPSLCIHSFPFQAEEYTYRNNQRHDRAGRTKYIAIAVGPVVASPGGVVDYAQLWTRADAGVVAVGANVSQWTNQATTISMTAQATMAVISSSVSVSSNDFNYNPSITFNGASNQKLAGTFATPTVNPALMFAVVKKSNLPNVVYANPYSLGSSGASGIAYNNFPGILQ